MAAVSASFCSRRTLLAFFILLFAINDTFAVSWGDRPQLDQWTVVNGNVSAPCPVNSECTEEVHDDGFMQRKVTDEFGNSFYQHVLTEPGASGLPYSGTNDPFSADSLSFHDEHIIRTGLSTLNLGAGDQIMNRTHVVSKTFIAESEFVTPTLENRMFQINGTQYTGNRTGNWPVWFTQKVSQIDWSGVNPVELMSTKISLNGSATFGGGSNDMSIDQTVDLGDGGQQGFVYQKESNAVTSHVPDPFNPLLPGGTNGSDVEWATRSGNRTVTATWVGQSNPTATPSLAFGMTAFRVADYVLGSTDETKLVDLTAANPPVPWHPDLLALNSHFSSPDLFALQPAITPTAWTVPTGLVGTKPHETPAMGTGGGGPPIPLGGWTVSNGIITMDTPCPTGAICGDPVTANGILIRDVIVGGVSYVQTIITEAGATGNPNAKAVFDTALADFQPNGYLAFADESFVRRDSVQGVSLRNQHAEVGMVTPANGSPFAPINHTWDPFTYDTRINVGWALGGAADPKMTVSQRLDSYNSNNAGVPGKVLQNVFDMAVFDNGAKDYTMISSHGYNTHYSRTIEGGIQNTTHIPDPFNPLLPDLGTAWGRDITGTRLVSTAGFDRRTPSNGGDITWAAGDALNVTWIGTNYRAPASEIFQSATSFTNLTTGERTALTNRSAGAYIPGLGRQPITPDGLPWPIPFANPTLPDTPNVLAHPFPPP